MFSVNFGQNAECIGAVTKGLRKEMSGVVGEKRRGSSPWRLDKLGETDLAGPFFGSVAGTGLRDAVNEQIGWTAIFRAR